VPYDDSNVGGEGRPNICVHLRSSAVKIACFLDFGASAIGRCSMLNPPRRYQARKARYEFNTEDAKITEITKRDLYQPPERSTLRHPRPHPSWPALCRPSPASSGTLATAVECHSFGPLVLYYCKLPSETLNNHLRSMAMKISIISSSKDRLNRAFRRYQACGRGRAETAAPPECPQRRAPLPQLRRRRMAHPALQW
jgi:hypothetical protein